MLCHQTCQHWIWFRNFFAQVMMNTMELLLTQNAYLPVQMHLCLLFVLLCAIGNCRFEQTDILLTIPDVNSQLKICVNFLRNAGEEGIVAQDTSTASWSCTNSNSGKYSKFSQESSLCNCMMSLDKSHVGKTWERCWLCVLILLRLNMLRYVWLNRL